MQGFNLTGNFLVLIIGLWASATMALPCPTCPKQMLYLPTDKITSSPGQVNQTTKIGPSKKTQEAASQNVYTSNHSQTKMPVVHFPFPHETHEKVYGSRMRNLGLDQEKTKHDSYVCGMSKASEIPIPSFPRGK